MSPAEIVTLALAGVFVLLAVVIGIRAWQRSRITPAERERKRRMLLVAIGKMGDANLVEVRGDLVFYSYDVRGVQYTASQDVSALRQYIPPDLSVATGPVFVKYDGRNPANSLVLAETWNGLRIGFTGEQIR
jgi:hypothetical protein